MTEEQANEIADSYLDVDSINDIELISEPIDQDGLTDGTTSTDEIILNGAINEIEETETTAPADVITFIDADDTDFVPVNYTIDADNNFINLDATDDDETIIDVADEDPYM